jgi:endonuclease YncB( thermonuclease family)
MSIKSLCVFIVSKCCLKNENQERTDDILVSLDSTTPIFTLENMIVDAKIVDVHDGDTVKAVFKVFNKYYKWNCRIAHVDTPELRTENLEEKERGLFVRDKLREQILNKVVTLHCLKFDKYGRLLIEIVTTELDVPIHEWLIQNKYANPYEGKTKIKFVKKNNL